MSSSVSLPIFSKTTSSTGWLSVRRRIGQIGSMPPDQPHLPGLPDLPGAADHLELCLRLAEQAWEARQLRLRLGAGRRPRVGPAHRAQRGGLARRPDRPPRARAGAVGRRPRGAERARRAASSTPPASTARCAPPATRGSGSGRSCTPPPPRSSCSGARSGGSPAAPVAALPITDVAPGVRVHGPVPPYDDRIRALHERGAATR